MEGVSAESNAMFIAFRRLVYSFSQQVNKDESQAIVYIRLYSLRERYKDSTTLEVLSKLEAEGVLGPSNPEGLLEIAKDIKRQDLVSEVKDFIKKRSKSEKKASSSSNKKAAAAQQLFLDENLYADTEEDMQLKATIEVTLAQATVLIQQVEILERAVAEGKAQRQRAKEAISEAEQTAAALADRLRKAQIELGLSTEQGEDAASYGVSIPGEAVGTFSHPISIGTSGQYALQPIPTVHRQSPICVPKQCSDVQGKSDSEKLKTVAEHDGEDEDEDDYEKMLSFVADEEEIKAWRMSLISQGTNYGRFTPPPRTDLHGSRPYSSQFSSVTRSQNEREFRPYSYAPSLHHMQQPEARYIYHEHGAGASASYGSLQQTSGLATNAMTTNSPRSQHGAPNVQSSNNKGNSLPTLNSPRPRLVSYKHSASPQTMHKLTVTTVQGVNSPPTPPQRHLLHGVSGSPTNRPPTTAHSQPSNPALRRVNCSSQETNSDNELDSCRSMTQLRSGENSGNVSLVKVRLQELEKPAISAKPALSQKPSRPAAKLRKPVSSTLKHNSFLQKELANVDECKMKAASTMPRTPSSLQTSFTQLNKAINGNEDEAYSIMHPSSSTLSNAGDSGFEDVRPLQRLDQESDTKGDSPQPAAPIRPGAYTGLLNQKTTTSDRDGYSQVRCYTSRPHE